jgi:adenylate kinase family enzyme
LLTRIHITGASGSGTTTLGLALSQLANLDHFDTDDYFWEPSDPPYQHPRPKDERIRLLTSDLDASQQWVLSGSLGAWAEPIFHLFELVVFLYAPTNVRLARLRRREVDRFGLEAISSGGKMYHNHLEFIDWASQYDAGDESMRSLRFHEQWLAHLDCPVIRVNGELATTTQVERVLAYACAH